MRVKKIEKLTPSEFYKMKRPEYFSDSEITFQAQLPREHLAYELSKISTNQKQDEFETLCRRLAEKFITPNLIPQVGPTGGGDGKTDSETYPVSTFVSDRWFVPENGWQKDEKWGFAISSKETWKSKARDDIEKIINTKRGYTRIYFMTNQTPSSKKKKDAQDKWKEEFGIDIIILDKEWILEKIYNNDLVELAVDSLNLSEVYKKKKVKLGQKDSYRLNRLNELEEKINNSNRYFEYDFQMVEDAFEVAILSRMLEKPRDEVEGKFERAYRLCKKVNNKKQWVRFHYQRAWTYLNWYDDYPAFIQEFKNFKKYISNTSSISEIELYINLFNLLKGIDALEHINLSDFKIDLKAERKKIYDILEQFDKIENKPCSTLIAKTLKALEGLLDSIINKKEPDYCLRDLTKYIESSKDYLDYPFESFKETIQELGKALPNHSEFDNLIDCIALVSEKRNSELAAGEIFLKRGSQKLFAKNFKESIVYFGKAVLKLAKEESQDGMYLSLIGLAQAFSEIGLLWASNNCLLSAFTISFKTLHETGVINKKSFMCAKLLAINELFIGRIPSFLSWYELFRVIYRQIDIEKNEESIPIDEFLDACFANRILNTNNKENHFALIPDLLEKQELWISQNSSLYKLGYTDQILSDYKIINIYDEKSLDEHFEMIANQPFRKQMKYETNFMYEKQIILTSKILGCEFILRFEKDIELLLTSEMLLAFFESFLSTSLTNVFPKTESIIIEIVKNTEESLFKYSNKESSSEFILEVNKFDYTKKSMEKIWTAMIKFTGLILTNNFLIKNPEKHLINLFKKEELHERLTLIFEHRNFTLNILGKNPQLFLDDWIKGNTYKHYPIKRETPLLIELENKDEYINNDKVFKPEVVSHDKSKVFSIIDDRLWDKAKWKGFGFFYDYLGMGIFIAYEDIEAGKKIFDNWIKKFGKEDIDELIKISIIKGIDKNNPFWYRVIISSNIKNESLKPYSTFYFTARIHEMNPKSSENLDILTEGFKSYKQFRLCPVEIKSDGKNIKPDFSRTILKKSLFIRNAWEIGENDLDSVVIKKGDSPIIPDDITDVPVLKLLKK